MAKRKKNQTPKTVEERISQGNGAEALLQSPFFEAYEKLEDNYINAWISSNYDDDKKREQCYISLKVLSEIRLELESMINSGKIAKQQGI